MNKPTQSVESKLQNLDETTNESNVITVSQSPDTTSIQNTYFFKLMRSIINKRTQRRGWGYSENVAPENRGFMESLSEFSDSLLIASSYPPILAEYAMQNGRRFLGRSLHALNKGLRQNFAEILENSSRQNTPIWKRESLMLLGKDIGRRLRSLVGIKEDENDIYNPQKIASFAKKNYVSARAHALSKMGKELKEERNTKTPLPIDIHECLAKEMAKRYAKENNCKQDQILHLEIEFFEALDNTAYYRNIGTMTKKGKTTSFVQNEFLDSLYVRLGKEEVFDDMSRKKQQAVSHINLLPITPSVRRKLLENPDYEITKEDVVEMLCAQYPMHIDVKMAGEMYDALTTGVEQQEKASIKEIDSVRSPFISQEEIQEYLPQILSFLSDIFKEFKLNPMSATMMATLATQILTTFKIYTKHKKQGIENDLHYALLEKIPEAICNLSYELEAVSQSESLVKICSHIAYSILGLMGALAPLHLMRKQKNPTNTATQRRSIFMSNNETPEWLQNDKAVEVLEKQLRLILDFKNLSDGEKERLKSETLDIAEIYELNLQIFESEIDSFLETNGLSDDVNKLKIRENIMKNCRSVCRKLKKR